MSEIDDLEATVWFGNKDAFSVHGWRRWLLPKADPETVERARVMYVDQNKTAKDVELALGLGKGTVSAWACGRRWPPKPSGPRQPAAELVERARQLYTGGLSAEKVGSALGVSRPTVARWARKGGWSRAQNGGAL